MDHETRTVLAEMRAETQAGFVRIDRYFELSQAQHLEVRGDITRLDEKVSRLDEKVSGLEQSLRSFRDWVTVQFAELRTAIQQLTTRVDRLERRQSDHIG